MKQESRGVDRRQLRTRLIGMLAALVTASVLLLGLASVAAFDRAIKPELDNRTRLIGTIVRAELQRAIELGIPVNALSGLDRYLVETLARFEEVDRIVVSDRAKQEIAAVNRPRAPSLLEGTVLGEVVAFDRAPFVLPILHGNDLVGEIKIETNPLFVQTRLRDVFLDVMALALVATLVAVELSLAVAIATVGKPLDRIFRLLDEQSSGDFRHCIRQGGLSGLRRVAARLNDHAEDLAARVAGLPDRMRASMDSLADARVAEDQPKRLRLSDFNDIRLALFLFSVATEIAAAFLPIYARAAARPNWLGPDLAAAAPLLLYLAALGAISPFGGVLASRFGPRRLFLASVPPTALALVAMGLAGSLMEITIWRGVMAFCYATATIGCQEYAIRAAGERASARPVGTFIAVVYGGVFCGSAIGGVIAGHFGVEAAFLFGAAIALLSGLLALSAMHGRSGDPGTGTARAATGPRRLPGIRVMALLLGVTVPMNAATAIFIWYLTPLMLAGEGSGPSEIARVVMLYYLAVVVFGPTVTWLSDNWSGPGKLITLGVLGSAAALLSLTAWSGFWAIVVAVAGLGLGHVLIRTPQYALTLDITEGGRTGIGALRFLERMGALLGLGASSLVLGSVGPVATLQTLGLVALAGGGVFALIELAASSGATRMKKED